MPGEGGGPTNEDFNVLRGYQIKANVTKDFDDGKGYIRLNFKRLDEHAPTNTTMPSLVTLKGNKITDFKPLPTFDARDGSTYSIYNRNFRYVDTNGALQSAEMNGIHPKVTSVGAQFHYELSDMLTVDNNFRYTDMSGSFTTQFLNVATTASVLGSTVNGRTVGSVRYAAGPQKGQVYTGAYLNNNPNINTLMKDMGSIANNLALTGKFEMGEAKVTVQAGWFHMSQNIVQDWHVNRQYSALEGENASPLNLFSTTGTQLTSAGQAGFNDNWGNCCARTMDLKYTDDAPFLSANYSGGGLDLDASVRFDRIRGEGTAQAGVAGPNFTVTDEVGTATLPSMLPGGVIERINYKRSYTSWSIGALYAFTNSTSVFARVSRGGRFNADRRALGGNFNADGSLNAQGASTAVNFLNQQEVGVKHRGFVGDSGNYSVEVTGFRSSLTENNYDFTRINNPAPNNDPNISNAYRSWGVEFTGRLNMGDFHLAAGPDLGKPQDQGQRDRCAGGQPSGRHPQADLPDFAILRHGVVCRGHFRQWPVECADRRFQHLHVARHHLLQRLPEGAAGGKSGTGAEREQSVRYAGLSRGRLVAPDQRDQRDLPEQRGLWANRNGGDPLQILGPTGIQPSRGLQSAIFCAPVLTYLSTLRSGARKSRFSAPPELNADRPLMTAK